MQTVNAALIATDVEFAGMTDADIRRLANGIQNFEFSPYNAVPFCEPTPEMRRRLAEMRERLSAMRQRRHAARPSVEHDETLCDCGHNSAQPMSSSRGTCCPDCYDRMSN